MNNKTRTVEEIEKEITQIKQELNNVHGTETEVYARIVGYYRAVKHWNKGKRDEFNQRKMFDLVESSSPISNYTDKENAALKPLQEPYKEPSAVDQKSTESLQKSEGNQLSYEMFIRKTCPNCPPVKNYMQSFNISGRTIDVDTKEGLAEAAKKGIFASPTVIFYNSNGTEAQRCHNVEELKEVFKQISDIA